MRVVALLILSAACAGLTGMAYLASAQGWGLTGLLEQPVSVRQRSVTGSGRGPTLLYFGGPRRHYGGGFRGGK